ncbi:MAG: hypothetical protein ACREH9_01225 [Pseudomonadota bacterium]
MNHPSISELALLAGGELNLFRRLRVRRHVSRCADCHAQADSLRSVREQLQLSLSELPEDLSWDRLAEEMTANIHVGLAAGECVGPAPKMRRLPGWNLGGPGLERRLGRGHLRGWNLEAWGVGAVGAGLCLLLALGWWMRMPSSDTQALTRAFHTVWTGRGPAAEPLSSGPGVVLEANTGGIEVKQNGRAMTFVSPSAEAVTVSVSLQGSAQASYVDSQTGQVTIANVYAQ